MAVLAAHLQREGDVVQHGAVRQQAETLEDHAHLVAAQVDQLFLGHFADVLAFDLDRATGDIDQPRKTAHKGRLARAGKPHDHKHFPLGNVQ